MKEESKLTACKVTESTAYTADGDSAWFDIDVIDKIYGAYLPQLHLPFQHKRIEGGKK